MNDKGEVRFVETHSQRGGGDKAFQPVLKQRGFLFFTVLAFTRIRFRGNAT
jgi:hypothetical protein